MKTVQLNKKSWHYRLVNYYGNFEGYNCNSEPVKTNICDYSKEVLFGLFRVLLITLGILVLSLHMMMAVLWAIACIQVGVWVDPDEAAAVGIVFFAAAVVIGLIFVVMYGREERLERREAQETKYVYKEPGFLKIWYTNFKSKTCVPIELK